MATRGSFAAISSEVFALEPAAKIEDVLLTILAPGVIEDMVLDPAGKPIPGTPRVASKLGCRQSRAAELAAIRERFEVKPGERVVRDLQTPPK